MFAIVSQVIAFAILAGGIWLGYRKWVEPHRASLDLQQTGALLLILLAFVGGFVGSWFWWANEPRSFSWDLPPLASRMLASAGWSFFVVCWLALQRPTFRRVRLVMLLLFVYLAPLAAAIFLFHLDRFDPAAPITYTFFATAILMTVSSTWYLFRPCRIVPDSPTDSAPSSRAVKIWLIVVTLVTSVWGLALFVADNGPSSLIWVWPGDLLSSRLIGVMLLTIAAGAVYSLRQADTSRTMLMMITTYGLGLATASFWYIFGGKPIKGSYLIVFGAVFLGSAALLLLDQSIKPDRIRNLSSSTLRTP